MEADRQTFEERMVRNTAEKLQRVFLDGYHWQGATCSEEKQ